MPELRLEMPGVPPTGNHYKGVQVMTPRSGKAFVKWYVTTAAEGWYWDLSIIAAGRKLRGATYTVSYAVYTAGGVVTDVDNYAKCILDGLAKAGVIDNDKKVIDLHGYRRIDRANPRTVIIVRTDQEQMFGGNECK
jgi:hypothetical protein